MRTVSMSRHVGPERLPEAGAVPVHVCDLPRLVTVDALQNHLVHWPGLCQVHTLV